MHRYKISVETMVAAILRLALRSLMYRWIMLARRVCTKSRSLFDLMTYKRASLRNLA